MALIYKVELRFKGARSQPSFVADVPACSTPEAVEKTIAIASGCGYKSPIRRATVLNIYKESRK